MNIYIYLILEIVLLIVYIFIMLKKSPDDFETTDELLRYWGFNPDNCQYMFSSVELDLNYIFEPIKN